MTNPSSPEPNQLNIYSIGLKLRTLRNEKRLTLTALARETGYSTALLSKLETGNMVPTLQTLERIGRVYGIALDYFFSLPTAHSLAITREAHTAKPYREIPRERVTPLHVPTASSKQVSTILDLPPGATSIVSESGSITVLTAYVISGALNISIGGINEVLQKGDCVVLDTEAAVIWGATDSPCRLLAVSAR